MAEWYFRPKSPGETIREPVQGEFFATDAISDPGIALIREGIQNALDASKSDQKVLVRVFVSGPDRATGYERMRSVASPSEPKQARSTRLEAYGLKMCSR